MKYTTFVALITLVLFFQGTQQTLWPLWTSYPYYYYPYPAVVYPNYVYSPVSYASAVYQAVPIYAPSYATASVIPTVRATPLRYAKYLLVPVR
ncbi:hypothetical protein KIN20_003797 [Parelaphostrongylus tenuis]|uniref:Uncharacterized protein n=1 Tax=Parelaphostrongylus tenuis TaxID=148309 RepID=A0AAD5MGA0_PARTN|nr:hypothetical protein KIN20_003797 [Parelaphostrongylus tenuis]